MVKMQMRLVFVLFIAILVFVGCAHQPYPDAYNPPGFLMGAVHGLIVPFALIGEIFTDVRIYAFPNSGGWYDLGFVLGLSFWGAGTAASQR